MATKWDLVASNRLLSVLAVHLILAAAGQAAVIADLAGDFTSGSFPAGWQYLRNTGPIGTSANYTPLLWDAGNNMFNVDGVNIPAPGFDYTHIRSGGINHPGRGTAQGEAFNGYMIAAYTIQPGESGVVSLIDGSIQGLDPNGSNAASNGWDVRIYVGDAQSGSTLMFPWSSSAVAFSQSIGVLGVGDTVYVGLGPNGSHLFDSDVFQFRLDSVAVPEPGSLTQAALGLVVILWGLSRRRR